MKILVIYTGGTIGSKKANGVVSTNESTKGELIKRYYSNFGGDICFREMSPFTILSENLNADALNKIIALVLEESKKDYDGIIVTHGTDTLSYTACALSLALGDSIPVLLVSSNFPLEDKRANGFENFVGAVEFIKAGVGRGAFVSYKNLGESLKYHRGDRVMLHNAYTDFVESLLNEPFAEYDNGCVNSLKTDLKPLESTLTPNLPEYSGVLCITSHPADDFSYCLDNVKAIIITTYHSGTLNTSNLQFVDFCKRAGERNIPIYAFNVPEGNVYESEKCFDDLGVKRLPVCSFAYAYIKLWQNSSAF